MQPVEDPKWHTLLGVYKLHCLFFVSLKGQGTDRNVRRGCVAQEQFVCSFEAIVVWPRAFTLTSAGPDVRCCTWRQASSPRDI